jgi:hypothetical protein
VSRGPLSSCPVRSLLFVTLAFGGWMRVTRERVILLLPRTRVGNGATAAESRPTVTPTIAADRARPPAWTTAASANRAATKVNGSSFAETRLR